jgi:hypothetical protein
VEEELPVEELLLVGVELLLRPEDEDDVEELLWVAELFLEEVAVLLS